MKLWHYLVPPKMSEGWGEFMLGENGFFAAVSDYGNYSYGWWAHGTDDFRKFILRARQDWDYFAGKFNQGHPLEYNGDGTERNIKRYILECRRGGELSREEAREEFNNLEFYDISTREGLSEWYHNTKLDGDLCELPVYEIPSQIMLFCKKLLPRLCDIIEDEMAKEKEEAA